MEPAAADSSGRFLAGRHPIEAFGQGGFRFGGMSHRGGILCLPSGVRAWFPPTPFRHVQGLYDAVVAEAAEIDLLLIGCGALPLPLPTDARALIRDAGLLQVDTLTTAAAAGTYNVLLAERRRVAAALAAVT